MTDARLSSRCAHPRLSHHTHHSLAWTGPGQIPNGVHTVYPPGAPGGLDVFCSFDLGDTLLPNVPDAGEAPVVESAAWTLVASEAQYHEQALTFLDQVVGSAADVNNGGVVNQGGSGGVGNGNVGPYFHPVNEADGVRYPYDRVLVEYGPQNGSPAHYYAFSVDWHFFSGEFGAVLCLSSATRRVA